MAQSQTALVSNPAVAPKFSNCFTVSNVGEPTEGIMLSSERGPNPAKPWLPHVNVGGYRLNRDRYDGCAFKKVDGGGLVHHASVRHIEGERGEFYTLTKSADTGSTLLVKVNLGMKYAASAVMVHGREIRVHAGVHTDGAVVAGDWAEYLVELDQGEHLTCFFVDGAVRTFRAEAGLLLEDHVSPEVMLDLRIAEAWRDLEGVVERGGNPKVIQAVCFGMMDLLHLTRLFDAKGLGLELRVKLLRDFFLELDQGVYYMIDRTLRTVVYQVDLTLTGMLDRGPSTAEVVNIADARAKAKVKAEGEMPDDGLTPAERRERNRLLNEEERAKKIADQAAWKAAHPPKPKSDKKPDGTKKPGKK